MTGRLHRAALAVLAMLLVTGCASIEAPRVGTGPPTVYPGQLKRLSAAPVKGDAATFAFRPMSGAPAEMLFQLEDDIKKEATVRDIRLVAADDPAAVYYVQGYISAVGDTHSALMVYVWDVFYQGNRIHRFSGQEPAPGSGSDPWSGVTENTVAAAARETIDAMAEWIRE